MLPGDPHLRQILAATALCTTIVSARQEIQGAYRLANVLVELIRADVRLPTWLLNARGILETLVLSCFLQPYQDICE